MNYRIEDKPPMRFVGVKNKLKEDYNENKKIIPKIWAQAYKKETKVAVQGLFQNSSDIIYGVTSFQQNDRLSYYIAVPTEQPVPHSMSVCDLPANRWAIFDVTNMSCFGSDYFYRWFYTEWLPTSKHEYLEIAEIEVFSVNGRHRKKVEIWITVSEHNVIKE